MANDEQQTNNQQIEIIADVGKAAYKPHKAKFTPKRRKLFLQKYAETFNITQSCIFAGVSREAHYDALKETDNKYRAAFQTVKDAYLDAVESTRITVALQPSRDGHQDAKMMLAAHRRETYGHKVDVNQNIEVKVDLGFDKMVEILQANNLIKPTTHAEIPDVDFEEIEDAQPKALEGGK